MEKIKYLFRKAAELQEVVHLKPTIAKAQKVAGKNLNSLDGLLAIAKAFSIKVVFVGDFPDKVRGYSQTVDDEKYIFLNKNDSHCILVYTLQHELGHHLMDHFCPSTNLKTRVPELEAQIFALFLFLLGEKDQWVSLLGIRA